MSKIREVAFDAANDIADDFVVGFFDHRMVENVAAQIEKRIEPMIKESIDALNKHSETLDCNNDYEAGYLRGFEKAIDFLTEHFGVKQ